MKIKVKTLEAKHIEQLPYEHDEKFDLLAASPQLFKSVQELLIEAKESLDAIGGCDHGVGICCCELIRRIENAEFAVSKALGQQKPLAPVS